MDAHDRLLELIQRLYAAPGSTDGWHAFLLELCNTLDATGATFLSHDITGRRPGISLTARVAPEAIREYTAHWGRLDPWVYSPRASALTTGTVSTGEMLIARADLHRTSYYNEFARHYDLTQSLAGMIEARSDRLSFISINTGDNQPVFGIEEVRLVGALMPHLQRALQIHRRVTDAEALAARSADVLDRLEHGVIMFDEAAHVVLVNRAAEAILRARDGLMLQSGELRTVRDAGTTRLRAIIAGAIQTSRRGGMAPGGALRLPRPSGRRPFSIVVAPLTGTWSTATSQAAAAVAFISDPERRVFRPEEQFRVLFGLTAAESQVAAALMNGETLDRVADCLEVSRNTIRTHLARLFAKTNTKRQAELMSVLLTTVSIARCGP